ncbi:MAG: hypothetical protein F4W92_03950 [Gammaproteobacteria bacterium]|nr:hypothetical protein [Gammaproteobacteria bacterium]
MELNDEHKISLEPYDPHQDKLLFRFSAFVIAGVAISAIVSAILLALYDQHDISLVTMGIGTTCLGALTSYFTQNISS